MNWLNKLLYHPTIIKIFNWEYWPFAVVHGPIMPIFIVLGLRLRSLFFFTASNPTIKNGGFLMESKNDIYNLIPDLYKPKTIFIPCNTPFEKVLKILYHSTLNYPVIAKPDIGLRGIAVKKIDNENELKEYVERATVDYLIQEFILFPLEAGIFYYRYPNEQYGNISGIVGKEFLSITGNGNDKIIDLLKKEKRFILQIPSLQKVYGNLLNEILPKGEQFIMVPYGNHARGAKFVDESNRIDETLIKVIDDFAKLVPEFFYGRLDIRFNSWEELKQGKNFTVIELNGAGSEPTHIYDPKHSYFFAWKEIIRHWFILWRISRINHQRGFAYLSYKEGTQMFRENKLYMKKLLKMQ